VFFKQFLLFAVVFVVCHFHAAGLLFEEASLVFADDEIAVGHVIVIICYGLHLFKPLLPVPETGAFTVIFDHLPNGRLENHPDQENPIAHDETNGVSRIKPIELVPLDTRTLEFQI
jgi:hypothetical protein